MPVGIFRPAAKTDAVNPGGRPMLGGKVGLKNAVLFMQSGAVDGLLTVRLIPLSQVGPYVVSWPPAPVNRDGCKGAGRGEGTNSERISGWLSG